MTKTKKWLDEVEKRFTQVELLDIFYPITTIRELTDDPWEIETMVFYTVINDKNVKVCGPIHDEHRTSLMWVASNTIDEMVSLLTQEAVSNIEKYR